MLLNLDWRWVGIGVAIMLGLNLAASLIMTLLIGDDLPPAAATPEEVAAALGGGRLALGALISIASFAIGGYVVGLKSPGRTILEPGISAAIAGPRRPNPRRRPDPEQPPGRRAGPVLAGLLGGYLGERRQSTGATAAGRTLP
jgi:hypothetical protein